MNNNNNITHHTTITITITPHTAQACLPAALLALQDVNNNKDILTNYHINLAAKDDEVRSDRYVTLHQK